MKKQLPPSPIEILITVTKDVSSQGVLKILSEFNEYNTILSYAKGTIESEISDLFGFGFLDRALTVSIIKTKNSAKILKRLSDDLGFYVDEGAGLAFTIGINSIEKNALNFLKKNVGDKNE